MSNAGSLYTEKKGSVRNYMPGMVALDQSLEGCEVLGSESDV